MLVVEIGPRSVGGTLQRDFVPVMCEHCRQPACMEACPAEAIYRASDGTVQIDNDLCERCGLCEDEIPIPARNDPSDPAQNSRERIWGTS